MVANPLKPKKLSDQVFERIRDLILKGDLKPGERLKAERDLCEVMAVSRQTVRQAIKKLVERGLVEHRQGHGTFICDPGNNKGLNFLQELLHTNEINLRELLEVRMALECQAASSAALRATGEDVTTLERHAREMRKAIDQGELGIREDVRFHMSLAYASKNQIQILMMKSLYDLLHFGIEESLKKLYLDPESLEQILSQHETIAAGIRQRDPEVAAAAMRAHIDFLIAYFCDESALLKQQTDDSAAALLIRSR